MTFYQTSQLFTRNISAKMNTINDPFSYFVNE